MAPYAICLRKGAYLWYRFTFLKVGIVYGTPVMLKFSQFSLLPSCLLQRLEEHNQVPSLLVCVSEPDLTSDSNTKMLLGGLETHLLSSLKGVS
jgi:hypothetical protein